jgi:ubiquinone/menaquinone biosynthesis C-methylase UbiE
MKAIRQAFIDRTARRPHGKKAMRTYTEPRAHYRSFRIILETLALRQEDAYFELGCGGGILLRQALEKVATAAAVDHSADMVTLSRANNEAAVREGRLQVVQGDVAELPWSDNHFSAGASANMFFFVKKPQQALNEAYRVLRPGGRFALVTLSDSLIAKLTFGWFYRLRLYSDAAMRTMLEAAGFSRVEVRSRRFFYQTCFAVKPK